MLAFDELLKRIGMNLGLGLMTFLWSKKHVSNFVQIIQFFKCNTPYLIIPIKKGILILTLGLK